MGSPIESIIIPKHLSKETLDRAIRNDYEGLLSEIPLVCDESFRAELLKRSLRGHASEGHSLFKKMGEIPNITDEYICSVLGDAKKTKEKSQEHINQIFDFLKRIMNGEKVKCLADKNGKPLFGIDFFAYAPIERQEHVLKGFVYGVRWDNYEWRKKVEEEWFARLGGGHCYAVDLGVMHNLGYDLKKLAGKSKKGDKSIGLEDKLEHFKKTGLIKKPNTQSTMQVVNGYIRMKPGAGISDNLGYLNAGLLLGVEGFLGAFLADAVDTLDKFTPRIREQDEQSLTMIEDNAKQIQNLYPAFTLPTEKETLDFIYAVMYNKKAKVDNPYSYKKNKRLKIELPDNSLRYFLQRGKSGFCNLEDHLKFVQEVSEGTKWQDYIKQCNRIYLLNHDSSIENKLLYQYIADRLDTVRSMRHLRDKGLLDKTLIESYNKGQIPKGFF